MTNAKDTFYLTLRDRLARLNPARTMVVRGVTRPGVLVEENELATDTLVTDVFRLRWTAMKIDTFGSLPLATMTCEVHYATAGTAVNGGMDRGRMLAAMDAELAAALRTVPHNVVKMHYAASGAGVAPLAMATRIFWSDVSFGAAKPASELVERVATVEVFCYQEVGE